MRLVSMMRRMVTRRITLYRDVDFENKFEIAVRVRSIKWINERGRSMWFWFSHQWKKIFDTYPPHGYRMCRQCKTIKLKDEGVIYGKGKHSNFFCSKECKHEFIGMMWEKYSEYLDEKKEELMGKEICNIIQKHDEEHVNDPEAIDIKKFLHKHVECGGKS